MNHSTHDARRGELAKIHIAKKDLALDDDSYRQVIANIGKAKSGSSADLSSLGRARVLQHFISKGWKPRHKASNRASKRSTQSGDVLASDNIVRMIRSIWIQMADAGVITNRDESSLRAWVRSTTRRYHPQHAGYSAPEFLPGWVAQKVVEHIKSWARRCKIVLHE